MSNFKLLLKISRAKLILDILLGKWINVSIGSMTRLGWPHLDVKLDESQEYVIGFTITKDEDYAKKISEIE